MQLFALIAAFGSIIVLVQAGGGDTTTQPEVCCMDAVFVLDISKSINNDDNFNLMKNFVKNTFQLMNISAECSHAAVILFARDAMIRFHLNEYTDETNLTKAVDEIELPEKKDIVREGTNTPAALNLLQTAGLNGSLGLRDGFIHIGIVITDGRPNLNHEDIPKVNASKRTETAGNRLHKTEIYDQIYAIGIEGNKPLGDTLKFIADPEELVFSIAGFDEELFDELRENISRQFCDPCLLKECPPGAGCKTCNKTNEAYCEYSCAIDNGGCPEDSQCAQVPVPTCSPDQCCSRVNITCSERCTTPCMDAVFVLDISISIKDDDNFNLIKDFVTSIFPAVNISAECSHAAVILFARDATIRFDLNKYTNVTSLTNAVNEIVYSEIDEKVRTSTNTPSALDLLRIAGLDGRLGLRNGFVHVGVVITDGRPNINHLNISRPEASKRTETAGNELHKARIYNQIYAIGIEGSRRLGDTLKFIADPEELVFSIAGFDEELFDELRRNISRQFCDPCLSKQCPTGTICTICEETNVTYCEYSCDVDNGGCPEGSQCAEVAVPTCNPGHCCSRVNITCSACTNYTCHTGSKCKVCEVNGDPYCDYSCEIDDGGCPESTRCELEYGECAPENCCSSRVKCVEPPCDLPCMDAVFVLDVSRSIQDESNFKLMKDFVSSTFSLVNISAECSHAALILFAEEARIMFNLSQYTDVTSLRNALYEITYDDITFNKNVATDTPDALDLMQNVSALGIDVNKITVGVVITDGRPNLNHKNFSRAQAKNMTKEAGERVINSGIYNQIYAVGIEAGKRFQDILEFFAYPSSLRFRIEKFNQETFNDVGKEVLGEFCKRAYCLDFPCPNGSECRVYEKTNQPYCEYSCRNNGGCPEGTLCHLDVQPYIIGECCANNITCELPRCSPPCMDAVFALDVSRSIADEEHFRLMQDFVNRSFSLVNISAECSHAAVIVFAAGARLEFNLNEYTDLASLQNALYEMKYAEYGEFNAETGTDTPAALDIMGNATALGIRDEKVHIAVVITDGRPNLNHKDLHKSIAKQKTEEAGDHLRKSGIYDRIYGIGIEGGLSFKKNTLKYFSLPPTLNLFITDFSEESFEELGRNFTLQFCNHTTCLNHDCPKGSKCEICKTTGQPYCVHSCENNGHCDAGQRCEVKEPESCGVNKCCSPKTECKGCRIKTDFVFLLDNSISLGKIKRKRVVQKRAVQNFGIMKEFIINVIKSLVIGQNDSMAGLILFAKYANISFPVSQYTNKDDLIAAINGTKFGHVKNDLNKGTHIPGALEILDNEGEPNGKSLRLRHDSNTTHIAIMITDGEAHTKRVTGNKKGKDRNDTKNIAVDLHQTGTYSQIYALGIGDKLHKDQLYIIANHDSNVAALKDFNATEFEEVRNNLTKQICEKCPINGQLYSLEAPDCVATCSNPNPTCSEQTKEGCDCPRGTVLDEIEDKCVSLSKCKCPRSCSHDFCTSELVKNSSRPVPCMRGPPLFNETECTDPCKLTYCNACYYSNITLPTPPGCDKCCEDRLCLACVREWAACVDKRDDKINPCKEGCETAENFKCYDYFGCK